ncbi:endonuclease VII domain-containing protein [Actinoallomurus sp. NPDC052308]|uniref:endonuclease VII domain-containing protein n=1 Tax=Actinoallomurus sp. NPDC052308 TaxID=3155530 RepID=UPI003444455E
MSGFASASKLCPDCGLEKPASEFRRNVKRPDGLGFYCRDCVSRREKEAYRKRRERQGKAVRERVEAPEGHKWCPGCKRVRPLNEWGRNKRSRDGYNSYCRECKNARSARDYLRKTHRLTPESVQRLIAEQGGRCLICMKAAAEHVDHDHVTGERRGVLCFNCNVALGQFKDDPWVLRRAIEYLTGGLLGLRPGADGTLEVAEVRRSQPFPRDDWPDRDFAVLGARVGDVPKDPWETDVFVVGPEPSQERFPGLDLSDPGFPDRGALPREPLGPPEWALTAAD